ncbi:hypothetical protein FO519_002564 [Halicephalobus sp. NKZ332]|nr:hypothetical protein FO519_002564 [Halicephalobus sp. NKZ332]
MSTAAPDVASVMAAAAAAAATQSRRLTPRDRGMFHLKRVMNDIRFTKEQEQRLYNLFKQTRQWQVNGGEAEIRAAYNISRELLISQATIVLLDKQTRFGRNPEMVDIVLHSDSTGNQMVSRLHAEIHAEVDPKDPTKFSRYYIVDKSLNGTYVNNRRAPVEPNKQYLNAGDIIRFGHGNGAAFKPGEYAQQCDSEFTFTFEPAMEDVEYLGHTPDGNRIERKGPKAYMHIGASSILPHEFDHFSLVPKREPDLSIVPLGTRGNKEQKRTEFIQAHAQLVLQSERGQEDPNVPPPNTFAATSVQIPGLQNPTVIPAMTNFDISVDMARILRDLQNQNGQTADQINAAFLQTILQQQALNQNFHYFTQPPANPLLANLNALMSQRLTQSMFPNNLDSLITALKALTTPVLNSQASFIPEFNNSTSLGGGSSAAATLAAVTSIGNVGGCTQANLQALQEKKARDELLNAIRAQQEGPGGSSSTPASTSSEHNDEFIIAQKKAQAEAEARRNEAVIAAVLNGAVNPASMNALHPEDRDLVISQASSVKSDPDVYKKKVDINEQTLKAIAEAAEVAAASTLGKKAPSPQEKPARKEKNPRKKKVEASSTPGSSVIRDHVQETIDAVAKRVIEEKSKPKRRTAKKQTEENSDSGKSKENVLKLLDVAKAEMEPEKQKEETPQKSFDLTGPSTASIPNPIPIVIQKDPEDDREQTSSVDSLIVCEASIDDPALLNPGSLNDGEIFEASSKPEILSKPSGTSKRKSSTGKVPVVKKRKQSVSTSESESEFEEKKSKKTIKKQNSITAAERGRKKSSSSVKQRVIRVPRSPIPSKKGPERIPGHKSNEVARLLYDLEGSYMHVARLGGDKGKKKKGSADTDEESSSDEDQPPAVLQKRKSIDGRTSISPSKKVKEQNVPDSNGNLSSSDSEVAPKKESSSESSSESDEPSPKKKRLASRNKKEEKEKKPKASRRSDSKKKRGRKAKNSSFIELTNGEWERCAFSGCKHPRVDGTVNWVQCDDCDRWFHILCAFGRDDKSVLEDEFHCGCKKIRSSGNATTTAVTA